jgi:opacity protein-like surface antigen
MITKLRVSNSAFRWVLRLQKTALLASSAALVMPFAARADCTINGFLGPGGAQLQSFLAATSNAATSAVTAMNTGFQTQTSAFVASPSASQPDQFASGVWGRAIGGRQDTDSVSTGVVDPSGQAVRLVRPNPNEPIPITCSTHTRNNYNGVQGGYDFGRLNLGASGWNVHLGVTGGFFETEATSQQGNGATRSQVPFVGVYGALVNGGFFIDAQVVAQFYDLSVSEPSIAAQGSMQGTGFGITSSAGYNFPLGNNFFIEPSVGVVYSRVHLDPLNITPMVLGSPNANFLVQVPSTLTLGDIETLPARAGIRVGTKFDSAGVSLQPFVTASVWHEFAGDTTASASFIPTDVRRPLAVVQPGTLTIISSTRIGTFGQYALGVSASVPGTGWLGYARVDYRNGQNIEALSVNGGLRYQFAPAPAVRAAPMYTETPVAAALPTWTGFYLGGFAGGAWAGDVTATELTPSPGLQSSFNGIGTQSSHNLGSRAIGGLTFGYNYQAGPLVAGLEAEGGYLRLTGSAPFFADPNTVSNTVSSTKIGDWYTALTGRVGFAFGPTLIYGKGGLAIVDVTEAVISTAALPQCDTPPAAPPGCRSVAAAGGNRLGVTWVAGAGIEYALSNKWSVKGEYLALGTDVSNTASGPGLVPCPSGTRVGGCTLQTFNWRHDLPIVQTAKIGLNYKL